MTTLRALATTAALLLTTTACSAADTRPSAGPLPSAEAATVEVTNNNWSDMTIYVIRSGMRQRLGTVTSMSTAQLEVPRTMMSTGADLQLLADPIGGSDQFSTGSLLISPGEQVEFTIQNHLEISHYSVRE